MHATKALRFLPILVASLALSACGGGGSASPTAADPEPDPAPAPKPDTDPTPTGEGPSLALSGCTNTVIVADFAYGACGTEIEVVSLTNLTRSLIPVAADDIAADPELGLLFTQSQTSLSVLSLADPAEPSLQNSATTNFSAFSGLSAANGVLVVSGGAGSSNTQIYTYSASTLTLATNGIPEVDSVTGNPDVSVTATAAGVTAFYSQDIGAVANFAIQPVTFDTNGQVINIFTETVLTAGAFAFNDALSPANFPVESEFLNDQLFVAHFAAQGIEVIDLANESMQLLSPIPLPYEPTNIATDGILLFVVGLTNGTVDIIDPNAATVTDSLNPDTALLAPVGVAASLTHVAVADRTNGLVVIAR